MMKLVFPGADSGYSLHNHTVFSDGTDPIDDFCRAGKKTGIKVLGVSDHWVVPPMEGTDYQSWAMPHGRLDEYVGTLLKLRKELEDENFSLKIGLEVDFFFENIDSVLQHLAAYPLDYLIGSVHYAGTFSVDFDKSTWLPLSPEKRHEITMEYYEKLAGAALRKEFTFIGHLDLPKKFALIDNAHYFPQAVKVLDALQNSSGAIEVNTAGYFKDCSEAYPSADILREARKREIPVIVNADAHSYEHLHRNYAVAAEVLKAAGYDYKQV